MGLVGRFLRDVSGSYAIAFTAAIVPLMGGVALAIDYTEMLRQKQATLNALDAAGIAAARQIAAGDSDAAVTAYARDFFEANLGPVDPADTELFVTLPTAEVGGETLKLRATLTYDPYFLPIFREMLDPGGSHGDDTIEFAARSEIRLKNTLEVALVLDNSGSMDYYGAGSGQKRIDVLKAAAKQLVDTIAAEAANLRQVDRPVQFSLVPFAGSVNVGPENATASWMDRTGISPVHHENFDWTTLDEPARRAQKIAGVWTKAGSEWGEAEGDPLTRFTLLADIARIVEIDGEEQQTSFSGWGGCVEARPHPHNVADTAPSAADPKTLFVPMFAPDEPGDIWETEEDDRPDDFDAANNWWNDGTESSSGQTRLRNMAKYYEVAPRNAEFGGGVGPNYSCTTGPITPLTDVTTEDGLATIKTAIDAMAPLGATNIPEGLAWGWRTVSSGEPFTGGRSETERGNDKVVIVLTDGINTYYTPSSLGFDDKARTKSTYAAHGYLQPGYDGTGIGRLFQGTTRNGTYSNANYTVAMNEHMNALCNGAKQAGVVLMTVALDLNPNNQQEATTIAAMRDCASESRFRKDPNDPSNPAKLFWNASSTTLAEDFERIADELSNLRIVS